MCETWMEDTRLLGRKLSAYWKVCMRKFSYSSSSYYFFFLTQKWWSWCWWWACVWKDSFDCITSTNEFSLTIVVVFLADFDAASYTTFPFRLFFAFTKFILLLFFHPHGLPACLLCVWMTIFFSFIFFLFHYIIICFSIIIWEKIYIYIGRSKRKKICFKWL